MDGARNQNRTQDSGGLLKTTTWGTLIATAILAAWGLTGKFVTSTDQQVQEPSVLTASNNSYQAPQAQSSDSYRSEPKGSVRSSLRPSSTSNAPIAVLGAVAPVVSTTTTVTPQARDNKTPPADHNLSSDDDDPQDTIAAKIAPDLKGIKPDAPVDVIVQFRQTPGASELVADGATMRAELPLVKAQLFTVRGADVANLASHSNVAYVSPNRPIRGALDHVVTAVNADLVFSSG